MKQKKVTLLEELHYIYLKKIEELDKHVQENEVYRYMEEKFEKEE
jgi:hypothetical protein